MELTSVTARLSRWISDSRKRTNLMIMLAGCAVLLILLSDCSGSGERQSTMEDSSAAVYASQLEERLEQMISCVEGAGQSRVMITLQNGGEYVYAIEDSISTDSSVSTDSGGRQSSGEREEHRSGYIIIDTEQGEQALVRTELMPSVSGVVVVCPGAEDPVVAQRIMSVVTTALDISPKRVCITQSTQ
ncbi:MAG: hypothetical protein E7554_07775 [Ruminococcaceae bacterium]|nr:hypothetical protein [Oscillospiraceae bacterium]